MTEVETIDTLVGLLDREEPFVHVRFGDGDVFFATGTGPRVTGDGEHWTPRLAGRLRGAWQELALHPGRLLIGDVETYAVSDGCEKEWLDLVQEAEDLRGQPLEFVHMEALRVSFGHALPFYLAASRDDRAKVFVGPERLASGAGEMINAAEVHVPLHVAHQPQHVAEALAAILGYDPQVVFFAAGRGGKILQSVLAGAAPHITQIDIGSGLDILFTDLRRGTDLGAHPESLRAEYAAAGLRV